MTGDTNMTAHFDRNMTSTALICAAEASLCMFQQSMCQEYKNSLKVSESERRSVVLNLDFHHGRRFDHSVNTHISASLEPCHESGEKHTTLRT
jgi:hypothetical protein